MSKISVSNYLSKVEEIYQEQPSYRTGGDGSDGTCDCIGMQRGATERCGVKTSGFRGTNDAARNKIKNLHKISGVGELKLGQLVLKQRPIDDPSMPLPDAYRPGGSKYNGDLTNYSHIGCVTKVNPLEITHMTSPSALKDTKLGKWEFVGENPWVDYSGSVDPDPDPEPQPEPEPTPTPTPETATTYAESGSTVNLRKSRSTSSPLVDRIPIGETVSVEKYRDDWCAVRWKGKAGYIMTKFLIFGEYVPGEDSEPEPEPDDPSGEDEEMVLVSRSDLIFIQNMIASMLGGVG